MDPVYGYQAVNVEAQERSPYSLLNWMKRLIGLRKQVKVFGRGTLEFLPVAESQDPGLPEEVRGRERCCASRISRARCSPWSSTSRAFKGRTPVEMFGLTEFPRVGDLPYFLTLAPYHFYWFRLQQSPRADRGAARAGNRGVARIPCPSSSWERRGTRCSMATSGR